MSQEFDRIPTDRELADQIDRAMDNWDTKLTPAERDRVRSEWVSEQREWSTKIHALPAAERARAVAEAASAEQAELAKMKRELVRVEAFRNLQARAEVEGERILRLAEERINALESRSLSDDEFIALREGVIAWARTELEAWAARNPVPTLADDERAVRDLLGEDSSPGV